MIQPVNNSNINVAAFRDASAAGQSQRADQNGAPVAQGKNADRVEISSGGEQLANFKIARNEQSARIERIKSEIGNGTYESDHRIDRTVDRLLGELSSIDFHA